MFQSMRHLGCPALEETFFECVFQELDLRADCGLRQSQLLGSL